MSDKKMIGQWIPVILLLLATGAFGPVESATIGDYGNDLNLAVSTIGVAAKTLRIDRACTAAAEVAVPSTLNVTVLEGGVIDHGSNALIFNGTLQAGEGRIFKGEGPVKINNTSIIRLEWFGVDPAGSARENGRAIQRAMNSVPNHGRCKVVLNRPGRYLTAAEMELTVGNVDLEFGPAVVFEVQSKNGLYIHGKDAGNRISDITVKNFVMDGGGRTQHGILAMYCDRLTLEGCRINHNGADGIYMGGMGVNTSRDCKIVDCEVREFGAFGIIAVGTHNLEVTGCRVSGCKEVRKCASAIQMKNSVNFNVHHNTTDGGEHGINIRCSSKGSDTTGICDSNESRNAVKVGIYCHHQTSDRSAGALRDLILTNNRVYNPGWFFLSVSAEDGHWATGITVAGNEGSSAGTNGMSFTNVQWLDWSDNNLYGVNGRGMVLSGVRHSTFSNGSIERTGSTPYPVLRIRNSRNNFLSGLTLIQAAPSQPCLVEEESDHNVFAEIRQAGCGQHRDYALSGPDSKSMTGRPPGSAAGRRPPEGL